MRNMANVACTALLSLCSLGLFATDGQGMEKEDLEKINLMEMKTTLSSALKQIEAGEKSAALDLLAEAIMHIRNSMPLDIHRLLLCTEVRGFSDFDAREGFRLKEGEPLLLYIEPEGFGIRKKGKEYWIWITQDASIRDAKGELIFQRIEWIKYNKPFSMPSIPFYLTNRVSEIPAGTYTYSLTLKDHFKKTFLTKEFEFKVE